MKRYFGIALAIVALPFSGCVEKNNASRATTVSTRNDDIDAIKQLAADWRAGWLAGDADALLALYASEPVLMPQDQPAVVGKEAIRSLYQSVLKDYIFESADKLMEVEASGDWGFIWSTYRITATPKSGGEPVKSAGKSIFIVKRDPGGSWKIARLIDNSDGATTD